MSKEWTLRIGFLNQHQMLNIISRLHNTESLELLEAFHQRTTMKDLTADRVTMINAVKLVKQQSPEKYNTWIQEHPDSPLAGILETN